MNSLLSVGLSFTGLGTLIVMVGLCVGLFSRGYNPYAMRLIIGSIPFHVISIVLNLLYLLR